MYVGLTYDDLDSIQWDYGDWHWPEVGVQLTTGSGRAFYAIWDSQVTHFELTFAEGQIRDQWLPLQESDPTAARTWDVSDHRRWKPLMNSPVTSYRIALELRDSVWLTRLEDSDDPPVSVPIALRLASERGVVWIAAAAPREGDAHEDIGANDVWLGHDEVIVVFDDVRADRLGLRAAS